MEWEAKTTMIQLGNKRDESGDAKKEFQDYCLKNVDSFDGQAWDMFCNLVDLIPDEMKSDFNFWSEIYKRIKLVDYNDSKFGLRSGMRIALTQEICEKELGLS